MEKLELLRDELGIYGYKFAGYEIIYRGDKVNENDYCLPTAFHYIPKNSLKLNNGLRTTIKEVKEVTIASAIKKELIKHHFGQDRLKKDKLKSLDIKSRKKYFAQETNAIKRVNWATYKCLQVADKNALRIARRFPFSIRARVYTWCCKSERTAQLFESFPYLAYFIYFKCNAKFHDMVINGASLKEIINSINAGMSMVFRKVKPQNVEYAFDKRQIFSNHPNLINAFMPWQSLYMMRWIFTIHNYFDLRDDMRDILLPWLAKNIPYKNKLGEIIREKEEIFDWIRATNRFDYAGRKFSTDITWKTAKRLSDEWHARRDFGALVDKQFPDPWLPGEEINGYTIEPITNTIALHEEGKEMHHCVYSYAQSVFNGECYIYSIKKKNKRIATMEVIKGAKLQGPTPAATIGQLRGPCNKSPDGKILHITKTWLDKNISNVKLPVEIKSTKLTLEFLAQAI